MAFPRSSTLWLLLGCILAAALGLARAGDARADVAPAPAMQKVKPTPTRRVTSEVLYPAQKIPLRFDHARHVGSLGLSCLYCHGTAAASRKAKDRLLPSPSRCDACHGTDHGAIEAVRAGTGPAKECSYCHVGHVAKDGNRVARVVIPPPNLHFDHAVHAARAIACAGCHPGVDRVQVATRDALPDMRSCLRCHGGDAPAGLAAQGACDVCHVTTVGSRLQTHFAGGDLLPPAWLHGAQHGLDWIERHKSVAGSESALCAKCHAEQECVDCHDGRVRPRRIHPNDWLSLHAMTARNDGPSCTSCHRAQSFCITCHERSGVASSSPYGTAGNRGRFHPPRATWTDPPRSAGHHSWEAERNLSACVSCHTERDCAGCHATAPRGGRGGLSPHPPGFSGDCQTALSKNPRPCLYCHEPSDRSMSQCR